MLFGLQFANLYLREFTLFTNDEHVERHSARSDSAASSCAELRIGSCGRHQFGLSRRRHLASSDVAKHKLEHKHKRKRKPDRTQFSDPLLPISARLRTKVIVARQRAQSIDSRSAIRDPRSATETDRRSRSVAQWRRRLDDVLPLSLCPLRDATLPHLAMLIRSICSPPRHARGLMDSSRSRGHLWTGRYCSLTFGRGGEI